MRRWMMAGAIGALAAAGFVLVMRMERPASAQGVTLDPGLVALLPPNATTLVGVELERLKGTSAWRRFEEQHATDSHFEEFVQETGFDPRRDVQDLLVASTGEKQFVAAARGVFDVTALGRKLREKNATIESYRGFELFGPEAKPDRAQQDPGRFCFLDTRTALAGSRSEVLAALDRKAGGGASLASNQALLGRAQQIGGTHQVWVVSDNPGQIVRRNFPGRRDAQASNFARIFQAMKTTTFALDLTQGLDLRAAGTCGTAQDAKSLADAVRGLVAIGRLSASDQEPDLLAVFDGIQVEDHNNELGITVRLDQGSFDKLLDKAEPRKRGARSAD